MPYYRGDCPNYAAGDYYRGDYYQGDFLGIGKALKKVAGFASNLLPGPLGVAARAIIGNRNVPGPISALRNPVAEQISATVVDRAYDIATQPMGPVGVNQFPGAAGPGVSLMPSGQLVPCQMKGYRVNKSGYYRHPRGQPQAAVYVPAKSVCVKTRRLNVANPRALRRAIRRAQGFAKLARRVMTFVNAKAPKGRAKFKRKR